MIAATQDESKLIFKASYLSEGSGSPSTVTIEQEPPDQLFSSSNGELLVSGGKTYYCSSSNGKETCIIYGSAADSPMALVMGVFAGSTYATIMQGWQTIVGAGLTGFHFSVTSQSFAGQASKCGNWSYQGSGEKYCITDSGVLAYVGTTSGSTLSTTFELTSFSTNVSSSDFNVPAGAIITSL